MHISEGVLSAPVLIAGAALAGAATAKGLKEMEYKKIPEIAVLSSAFFVASLIHIPIGPSSAHLVLNGLIGILLGWSAFPAILVGLALQAILFQFGGFTALGVNTFNMAFPALVGFWLFKTLKKSNKRCVFICSGFLSGALGILGGAFLVALSLAGTKEAFVPVAKLVVVAHIPLAVVEGVITTVAIAFLNKVKPELLAIR